MNEAAVTQGVVRAIRHEGAIPRFYRLDGTATLEPGTRLIAEDPRGGEEVVTVISPGDVVPPTVEDLPRILSQASERHVELLTRRQEFERKAFGFAVRRARERRLPLKFVRCLLPGDERVRLYFSCDAKVDYRDLVRDLSVEFGVEVELLQLGSREAAAQLRGLGPCGRPTCCSTFLKVFPSVSTRMGKDQGLSLTPRRLAGACGKLKCCLAYEADTYREYLEEMALKVGHRVVTAKGDGKIIDMDVLNRKVRVVLVGESGGAETFSADHVARIKGGVRPELPEAVRQAQAAEAERSQAPVTSALGAELNLDGAKNSGRRKGRGNGRRRGGRDAQDASGNREAGSSPKSSEGGESQRNKPRRRRRRRNRNRPGGPSKGEKPS